MTGSSPYPPGFGAPPPGSGPPQRTKRTCLRPAAAAQNDRVPSNRCSSRRASCNRGARIVDHRAGPRPRAFAATPTFHKRSRSSSSSMMPISSLRGDRPAYERREPTELMPSWQREMPNSPERRAAIPQIQSGDVGLGGSDSDAVERTRRPSALSNPHPAADTSTACCFIAKTCIRNVVRTLSTTRPTILR